MSFADSLTSNFPNPATWKKASFDTIDVKKITGNPSISGFGTPLVLTGNQNSTTPQLTLNNTSTTPNDEDIGLRIINSTGGNIDLMVQNTTNRATISTLNGLDINTNTNTGSIALYPNNSGVASILCEYISPTESRTEIPFLKFPNPAIGYIPSYLNYYEETEFSTTFSGPLNVSPNVNINITRVGDTVTLLFTQELFTAANTSSITFDNALPARFLPFVENITDNFYINIVSVIAGGAVRNLWTITDGVISSSSTYSYTSGQTSGWYGFSATYLAG